MRGFLIGVLFVHFGLGVWTTVEDGYFSVFPPFEHLWATQMFSDLAIALGMLWLLLFQEAKRKKRRLGGVFLCGIGMVLLGSLSPLVYLILNPGFFKKV